MSKNNSIMNPNARDAMDKFKMEAANEVGVNLKQGYNGDLTSRQAGSIGGQMVKKMTPIRTATYKRVDRTAIGHKVEVEYIAG
ncbi:MAG: alpha/beta-type small acid-soluble spore protein, partial [Oscillospiraceae bacterium]|nr:alpha/beta-type small acid-soluble spore protein [Oscillospiraceae bacterium]